MQAHTEHQPLEFSRYSEPEMVDRAKAFHALMARRRSVRHFSEEPVPFEVVQEVVRAAGTAPSGAHKQPWTFCVVGNAELKRRIREAAEEEERINYSGRMSEQWLEDLKPFATDHNKPFLEHAPWLVVVFNGPTSWRPMEANTRTITCRRAWALPRACCWRRPIMRAWRR